MTVIAVPNQFTINQDFFKTSAVLSSTRNCLILKFSNNNSNTHKIEETMPYTIVLTPPTEQAIKYVEVSQALYSDYQPNYLLTKDGTSSPYITVVQFECESSDLAHQAWAKMCEKMSKENIIFLLVLYLLV